MSTSWSTDKQGLSVLTATTGSETGDPPAAAEDGLDLMGLKGVVMDYAAAGAMTPGGYLRCYVQVKSATEVLTWVRAPELDQIVTALTNEAYPAFPVHMQDARVAFVPDGVGQSGTLTLRGSRTS